MVLLTTYPTFPGCVIKARPIGIVLMKDEKGTDNKIVAVPTEGVDPRFAETKSIEDICGHLRKEIEIFFADYKKLEKDKYKHVEVSGWAGLKEAERIIEKAVKDYEEK